MKTLLEYISENLVSFRSILEGQQKPSINDFVNSLTDGLIYLMTSKHIDNVGLPDELSYDNDKNNDNEDDKIWKQEPSKESNIKTIVTNISIGDKPRNLCFSCSPDYSGNQFLADKSTDKNLFIVMSCNPEDVEELDDTIMHELRHACDFVGERGKSKTNDTYGKEEMGLYNRFLYHISETEQNAFFSGFSRWIHKHEDDLKNMYAGLKASDVNDFVEKFCTQSWEYRNTLIKTDKKDETGKITKKLNKLKNSKDPADALHVAMLIGELRPLEYKFTILKDEDSLKKFIFYDTVTQKKRSPEHVKNIIYYLSKYANDGYILNKENEDGEILDFDLSKSGIYKNIMDVYNETFKNYINELSKVLEGTNDKTDNSQ